MHVKYAYNSSLTLKLRAYIFKILSQVKPVTSFSPALQFFKPEHTASFKDLDRVGEFTVEFLLVVTELLAIQERINYPEVFLTKRLYRDFGVKDRFFCNSKSGIEEVKIVCYIK